LIHAGDSMISNTSLKTPDLRRVREHESVYMA